MKALFFILANLIVFFSLDRGIDSLLPRQAKYLNKKNIRFQTYDSNPRGQFLPVTDEAGNITHYRANHKHESNRVYENSPPPQSAKRIVFLGDSFTEGLGVHLDSTYPKVVEKLLGQEKAASFNRGAGGTNIEQIYQAFNASIKTDRPDWIVYGYVLNDPLIYSDQVTSLDAYKGEILKKEAPFHWDLILKRTTMIEKDQSQVESLSCIVSRLVCRLIQNIKLQKISKNTVQHYNDIHNPLLNKEGLEKTFDLIADMKTKSESMGAQFLLVILPILYWPNGRYPMEEAHNSIISLSKENGIEVLNFTNKMAKMDFESLWVHPTDQHPNEIAHKYFAEQIAAFIKEASFQESIQ